GTGAVPASARRPLRRRSHSRRCAVRASVRRVTQAGAPSGAPRRAGRPACSWVDRARPWEQCGTRCIEKTCSAARSPGSLRIPYAEAAVPQGPLPPPCLRSRREERSRHARCVDGRNDGGVLRHLVRLHLVAGAGMSIADVLELALSVAMLGYLFYALIRPERF